MPEFEDFDEFDQHSHDHDGHIQFIELDCPQGIAVFATRDGQTRVLYDLGALVDALSATFMVEHLMAAVIGDEEGKQQGIGAARVVGEIDAARKALLGDAVGHQTDALEQAFGLPDAPDPFDN
jgi:hypothetical protein